jgi:hypothetical protein
VLFSGGLDSFAGSLEAVLGRDERVVLVSHHASNVLASKQNGLVEGLRERARRGRVFHVGVVVNKGGEEAADFTQRTRSFLFATLGFVVARLFRKAEVAFFENGVVSLNLPLAAHVVGARATRTTHPRVLRDFGRLFAAAAERGVRVANPYSG